MYITNQLIHFLEISSKLSNSTILVTDRERVLFVTPEEFQSFYLGKEISHSLKQILNLYFSEHTAINYLNTTMESIVPFIEKETITKYRSQIILPIVHEEVDGLLLFFVQDREYLSSNLKFAKTTKHFTEIFTSKDYLE